MKSCLRTPPSSHLQVLSHEEYPSSSVFMEVPLCRLKDDKGQGNGHQIHLQFISPREVGVGWEINLQATMATSSYGDPRDIKNCL